MSQNPYALRVNIDWTDKEGGPVRSPKAIFADAEDQYPVVTDEYDHAFCISSMQDSVERMRAEEAAIESHIRRLRRDRKHYARVLRDYQGAHRKKYGRRSLKPSQLAPATADMPAPRYDLGQGIEPDQGHQVPSGFQIKHQ